MRTDDHHQTKKNEIFFYSIQIFFWFHYNKREKVAFSFRRNGVRSFYGASRSTSNLMATATKKEEEEEYRCGSSARTF